MGIDLETYRRRIACLSPGRRMSAKRQSRYSPTSRGSDIHLRSFALCTCLLMICFLTQQSLILYRSINMETSKLLIGIVHECIEFQTASVAYPLCSPNCHISQQINHEEYSIINEQMLIKSGDIELNPGPITDAGEDRLLSVINSFQHDVMKEFKEVKMNVTAIQSDLVAVRNECIETKNELKSVKSNQTEMRSSIANIEKEVNDLRDIKEQLQLDIEHLNNEFHNKLQKLETIENDLDYLERASRKNSFRIFGLRENTNEDRDELKMKIVNEVLKVASPDLDWKTDDIKTAKRVGENSGEFERMVIASFRIDDNKFSVFNGRDALRNNGIRVSDDLTRRQREQLKTFKSEGKKGYFYRGKFVELNKDKQQNGNGIKQRTFKTGYRRSNTRDLWRTDGNQEQHGAFNTEYDTNYETTDMVTEPLADLQTK